MFETAGQVVKALKAFRDYYHPKASGIVLRSGKASGVNAEPFGGGFLNSIEQRAQLMSRLAALGERERALLTMWYVMDQPVRHVCEALSVSRSQAYRLRDRALSEMISDDQDADAPAALAPAFA
ncbi:MAG TPA: DUF1492 domain-containing protein [Actinomycetota bacterium]